MTNFGNKLEKYANGNLPACQHPINAVDDNRFCHKCGKQLPPMKYTSAAEQIATLTAHNAAMQDDAVNNTVTIKMLMAQLAEQVEENRGLRQMLHMEAR